MMKKTAIALGLAMVTSVGIAGQGGVSADAGANGGPSQANIDMDAAIDTQFNALDQNGDGVLSRAEASASKNVSQFYDSLDTSQTIEDRGTQSTPDGITREQFQAGMQAHASRSGSFGPSVAGGETYIIMRDGSRKLKSEAGSDAARQPSRAGQAMSGAANGSAAVAGSADPAARGAANAGSEAAIQRERARSDARSMQQRARGGVGQAQSEAGIQRDRARDEAAKLQNRARYGSSPAYGESRSRAEGVDRSNGSLRQSHERRSDVGTRPDTRIDAD